ncbi:MAG TPA: hypothetical protein VD770_02890, partial [Coxiellaceae bacterium]|nr:hypothetical protein [Coxiellaceae bacterium]
LPELEKEIVIKPLGEVYGQIIVSRLGYHIIYPIETATQDGKKLWRAKHILIAQDGYEQWFANQTREFKTLHIVK